MQKRVKHISELVIHNDGQMEKMDMIERNQDGRSEQEIYYNDHLIYKKKDPFSRIKHVHFTPPHAVNAESPLSLLGAEEGNIINAQGCNESELENENGMEIEQLERVPIHIERMQTPYYPVSLSEPKLKKRKTVKKKKRLNKTKKAASKTAKKSSRK